MKDNVAESLQEVNFFAATTNLWSSDSHYPQCTFYFHYPEVEEVSPVKQLKGLAAVLQHIAEKDDDMDAITYTLNSPTEN